MIATLIGASVGIPYVVSHKSAGPAVPGANTTHAPIASGNSWSWLTSGPAATLPGVSAATSTTPLATGQQLSSPVPLQGVRMHPVESVLRFDLTREWVYRNWDRKTTGPTDVGLLAVRVALVSGTDIGSLAGSLTYFFNDQGAIEHISFRGTTGDSRRLVDFLMRTYHFTRVPGPTGEQVYQVGSGDQVQSELRVHPEPVLSSSSPHKNIAVELELARPGSQRFLPPRAPALQIPQVATSSPPSTTDGVGSTAGSATSSAGSSDLTSGVKSYFDSARYATPEEESPMHWVRWPN